MQASNEPLRKLLLGKIHCATVTHADVAYEGSISLPTELMQAAGFVASEAVWVWNVTNGQRFETYIIEGASGSGVISVNGAAAHLVSPGDKVIVAAFVHLPESCIAAHRPKIVFVDESNRIKSLRAEVPGPEVSAFKVPAQPLALASGDDMLRG